MSEASIEAHRRRPRFVRAGEPPSSRITDRDIAIVRHVARHRFLRSTHVSALFQAPHKKVLNQLSLLYHAGYLDRPRAQLEYHARSGGSMPVIYALGDQGARLLRAGEERDHGDADWARKNRESGREFMLHTLCIADVSVALTVAWQQHGTVGLQSADDLLQSAPPEIRSLPKPWGWRVTVRHKGSSVEIGVIPDLVFALLLPDGRRRAFLVECDRGTMPVERATLAQTSMLRKFLAYESSRMQSIHIRAR